MPRYENRKVAEIRQITKHKTFGDRVKAFLEGAAGFTVFVVIIGLIFG